MKIKSTFLISGMLLFAFWSQAQPIEPKLQTLLDSVNAAQPSSIGVMLHVESPQKGISWSGASGYASKEKKTLLEADQPALIASNIKTYVSASILRIVEEGQLNIDQPIKDLLTDQTRGLFEARGYQLDEITLQHLLSHTSGLQDYANQDYIDFIDQNKKYRWTRDEQLALTLKIGAPLGGPGFTYNYADANYLLCTEILEGITQKPFYTAMRDLLDYQSLGLNNTWMPTLEEKPEGTKTLAHQYWSEMGWDTYDIDVSVDLYGGGGIACTTSDLARFAYDLFNYKVVKDTATLNLIYTEIPTDDTKTSRYYLGITDYEIEGYKAYGHSGFWGTQVYYFPELKTAIAVFVLERDQRGLRPEIVKKAIITMLE